MRGTGDKVTKTYGLFIRLVQTTNARAPLQHGLALSSAGPPTNFLPGQPRFAWVLGARPECSASPGSGRPEGHDPMAKNLLVINVDLRETRVALIEDGIIAELHLERASTRSTLGNIVLGRVTRVLPGMQAAFIDIGQERAAFLHVEDLIRPDDFEAYLSGGKRPDEETSPADEDEPGRSPAG